MRQGTPRGLRAIRGRIVLLPRSKAYRHRCHLGWAANVAICQGGCPSAGRTIDRLMQCSVGKWCMLMGYLYEKGIDARRARKLGTGVKVRPAAGLRPMLLPRHRGRHRGRRGTDRLRAGLRLRALWSLSKMTRRLSSVGGVGVVAARGRWAAWAGPTRVATLVTCGTLEVGQST